MMPQGKRLIGRDKGERRRSGQKVWQVLPGPELAIDIDLVDTNQ